MILYFSGTGNSGYAAKLTAEEVGDQVLDLFGKIRNKDNSPMESEKPWVVAAPVYSWQLPHVVDEVCLDVGGLASPVSLLVLGASLKWQGVKDNKRELAVTLVIKQLILPAVMVTLAALLGMRQEALGVIVILFGAPGAVSSYPMAVAMGADGTLAASQLVMTTICSMGTLFALIYVGKVLCRL